MSQSIEKRSQRSSHNDILNVLLIKNQFKLQEFKEIRHSPVRPTSNDFAHFFNKVSSIQQHKKITYKLKQTPTNQPSSPTQTRTESLEKLMSKNSRQSFWQAIPSSKSKSPHEMVLRDINAPKHFFSKPDGRDNTVVKLFQTKKQDISDLIGQVSDGNNSSKPSLQGLSDTIIKATSVHQFSASNLTEEKNRLCSKCANNFQILYAKIKKEQDEQLNQLKIRFKQSEEEKFQLNQKIQQQDQQIKKLLNNEMIKELEKQLKLTKIEKDILMKQEKSGLEEVTKEFEGQRKKYQDVIKNQNDQVTQLTNELDKYCQISFKVKDLEETLSKLILENQELKLSKGENQQMLKIFFDQLEQLHSKQIETKFKVLELKTFCNQLVQINHYLMSKQSPPLELLVQYNQQNKKVKTDQLEMDNSIQNLSDYSFQKQKKTLNNLFNRDIQFQMESILVINEAIQQIQNALENYQNKFISEIGIHLVSFN